MRATALPQNAAVELHDTIACNGEETAHCGSLAGMYAEGRGVPKDPTKAFALYRKACDGGEREACNELKRAAGR